MKQTSEEGEYFNFLEKARRLLKALSRLGQKLLAEGFVTRETCLSPRWRREI